MQNFFTVALPLLATVTTNVATLPFQNYKMQGSPPPFSIIKEFDLKTEKTATKEVAPEKPKETRLICKGCNENENATLAYFQDRGIKTETPLLPLWVTFVRNQLLFLTFVKVVAEPVGVTADAVTD